MNSTRQYTSPEQEQIDKVICDLSHRCTLLQSIQPLNATTECSIFLDKQGKYQPQFVYKPLDTAKIQYTIDTLLSLQNSFTASDPITQLQAKKVHELIEKYSLILAYQKQDLESIYRYNTSLFETIPRNEKIPLPQEGKEISRAEYLQTNIYDHLTKFDSEQAQTLIQLKCKQLGIDNYTIIVKHL